MQLRDMTAVLIKIPM